MPRNAPGEVNTGQWVSTREWTISLGSAGLPARTFADLMSNWSALRKANGRCLLVGQLSETLIALPGLVVDGIVISGEVSPEMATWCTDESVKRLLFRLTLHLLEETSQDKAWIRFNGESISVDCNWLSSALSG